jgi:5-formyltetrahydrofolate cyclo-ligase
MTSKPEVRRQGRERREALGEQAQAGFDARIVAHCRQELDWGRYANVMIFLPIEHRNEVDTWPLARWIWEQWPDVRIYVPRVVGSDIEAVQTTDDTAFAPGAYGVPEPLGGVVLGPKESLDLVLTPLLGFDLQGNRVGYGQGYFDRFFARYPKARRIGLGYECLMAPDGIAAGGHDVRLHEVITEERAYEF